MPVNKKPAKKLTAKSSKTEAPPSDEIVLDDAELAIDDTNSKEVPVSRSSGNAVAMITNQAVFVSYFNKVSDDLWFAWEFLFKFLKVHK